MTNVEQQPKISRRDFIKIAGGITAAVFLGRVEPKSAKAIERLGSQEIKEAEPKGRLVITGTLVNQSREGIGGHTIIPEVKQKPPEDAGSDGYRILADNEIRLAGDNALLSVILEEEKDGEVKTSKIGEDLSGMGNPNKGSFVIQINLHCQNPEIEGRQTAKDLFEKGKVRLVISRYGLVTREVPLQFGDVKFPKSYDNYEKDFIGEISLGDVGVEEYQKIEVK